MTKDVAFTVDGEPYETNDRKLTANEVLSLAGLDPANYYLIEIKGQHQESFQNRGQEKVNLHPGSKFITVFIGPTTVAHGPQTGAALFATQLRAAGFDVTELGDGEIMFPYCVEVGRHAGTFVKLGFVVPPDFPLTPPHGPHITPHFHPMVAGGQHPTGGIHPSQSHSKHFSTEWQHWSRPHPNWPATKRTAVDYMAFIRTLWATQ